MKDYRVENHRVTTWSHLERLLAQKDFQEGRGLKMVEVVVGKFDIPEKFREVFKRAGEQL